MDIIGVVVGIIAAAAFLAVIGGLSYFAVWAFIQTLPKGDQPRAWEDVQQAWIEQNPYGL